MNTSGRKFSDFGEKLNNSMNKLGGAAATFGKTVASALAIGGAAMGSLLTKSLNLAGELEQNIGGASAVFDVHAKRMESTAANAFKNMGLSQSDYLATANKMGALFQGMGFEIGESAMMTENAMQRAADVASIMGISTESAMEAVNGMAKGNYEMMDNLGVAMNDTALKAYALEQGIKKSYDKMSQQEKIGLAYQMFMEKSAYAAGNYAKENDTLAGSLSTAKAALENFLSGGKISTNDLTKAFVNVGNVVSKNVQKILPGLTKGITSLIQGLTPHIPGMVEEILPGVIEGGVELMAGLAGALPNIITVLVKALPKAFTKITDSLDKLLPDMVNGLTAAFLNMQYALPDLLHKMGETISKVWENGVWPMIQNLFSVGFGIELPNWSEIETAISNGWNTITEGIRDIVKTVFGVDLPTWEQVTKSVSEWWNGGVADSINKLIRAVFGLDMSDTDQDGVPWHQRILTWFNGVMGALGNTLMAMLGIDPIAVDKAVAEINAWWHKITDNLDLEAVFKLVGKVFEIKPAGGDLYDEAGNLKDSTITPFMREQYTNEQLRDMGYDPSAYVPGFASGLDFVPRDNFLARLHYGETVLNRQDATAWRSGGSEIGHALLDELRTMRAEISSLREENRRLSVFLDGKAAAAVMAKPMNRAIGNRNIQELLSMGG